MVQITQYFLTKNDCYKSGKKHSPKGIMVHSTGANNPELRRYIGPDDGIIGQNQYNNHWNQPGIKKCVHAFIGKDKNGVVRIYQTLPWDMVGWHSGSGIKGSSQNANNTGYIGFEMCEDDMTDKEYFNEVYNKAVELTAYLVKQFNIKLENVIGHYEGHQRGIASNHADPKPWFSKHGKTMDDFRRDVKEKLGIDEEIPEQYYYTIQKGDTLWSISKKFGMTVDELKKMNNLTSDLIFTGDVLKVKGPIEEPATPPPKHQLLELDGIWGPATTRSLQKNLGTSVDGIISGQYKNQITSAIPSVSFGPPFTGSQVIRAVQKKIGAKVDGFIGPETVRALQKYLGTPVDGVISKPSLMVKEMQRRLNLGVF